MSCRPVSAEIEPSLHPSSPVIVRDSPAAPVSDTDLDPAKQAVVVVSPQDMQRLFGPTLWRKGFLPISPPGAPQASPAAAQSGIPAATRSFSTFVRGVVRSASVSQGASLPRIVPSTLRQLHGTQLCPVRLSPSTMVGAIPGGFRSCAPAGSTRTAVLRSAFLRGTVAFWGLVGI